MDDARPDKPFLIVTGSSAGGIDALQAFLAGLPADLGAAVVVAQHLDRTHQSHLAKILSAHSTLPIKIVNEREQLVPSTVYVVPSNRDVAIVDSEAMAYLEARPGIKPSIDRLFSSAAEQYGEGVIAVILSGMGNDGLAGAREVKERGGTVIIQDPTSASFPAMPSAIPPNIVDLVAPPGEMGALIAKFVHSEEPPSGSNEQNILRTLLMQLRDRSGIDFLQYKMPTLMRRISRLMAATGNTTLADYVRYLQVHPGGYQKLASSFLIKLTGFFRDAELFEELKVRVLPKLIDEARASGEVRIWSAGTATGEEAYSLAMLCESLLHGDSVTARIFATDLDSDAIEFARRGIYSKEAVRDVPAEWLEQYFTRLGDEYQVSKRIRNLTVFGEHDLAQRAPFPRIDLVVCRNVLIYFTKELQTRALQLFAFALRQGGILVLGKAESISVLPQYFRLLHQGHKIYQRHGERLLIPPSTKPYRLAADEAREVIRNSVQAVQAVSGRPEGISKRNEVIVSLLMASSIGIILIDRRYDIITLNGAARTLLDIHGVAVGEDLIHLVQAVDRDALRDFIDATFRAEHPEPVEMFSSDTANGVERWLLVSAHAESAQSTAIVLFVEDTCYAKERRQLESANAAKQHDVDDLQHRMKELLQRQRTLVQANDELSVSNNELRANNEHLLIGAEESASANEEIETLNEELQATNEELETLNEELQATIEELNTTNDELESRGIELESARQAMQQQLSDLRLEKEALAQALASFSDVAVILKKDGTELYCSPKLDGAKFLNERDWWKNGELQGEDGNLRVTRRMLKLDGEDVELVRLDKITDR